jgi:hypothetical protein
VQDPEQHQEQHTDQEEHDSNSGWITDGARIISYNLNEDERPDGIRVRIKIRIETGKKGRARDARQAEAIRNYLTWAAQQEPQDEAGP